MIVFDPQKIGESIREKRKEKHWSQAKLGQECGGISGTTISHYETGEQTPQIGTLYLLSVALDCSIDELVKGKDGRPFVQHEDLGGAEQTLSSLADLIEKGHIGLTNTADPYLVNIDANMKTFITKVAGYVNVRADLGETQYLALKTKAITECARKMKNTAGQAPTMPIKLGF